MIDKLGLDGLGGASVRVKPTPQGTNGVTGKADAAPAVVGLEPVAEVVVDNTGLYLLKADPLTIRAGDKLYSAPDVARLQQENEEQARLLGISGSKEAKLLAELERVAGDLNKLRARVESVLWPNSGMAHVTMKGE